MAAGATDPVRTIAVVGEALIDLVETADDEPRLARPGGSPYNVAIGLARLGQRARFAGRISRDPLGLVLRNHALRSGVDLALCVEAYEPSTVALVELADDGGARYRFGVDGTADFRWTDAELATLPDTLDALHFGSLASWLAPGDAAIERRVTASRRHGTTISYDPNVRPHLQPDPATARAQVERALALAHLVKASAEDLEYLYPGRPPAEVARHWLRLGPDLVVLTRGGDGVRAVGAGVELERPTGTGAGGRHRGRRRRVHERAARRVGPARAALAGRRGRVRWRRRRRRAA